MYICTYICMCVCVCMYVYYDVYPISFLFMNVRCSGKSVQILVVSWMYLIYIYISTYICVYMFDVYT